MSIPITAQDIAGGLSGELKGAAETLWEQVGKDAAAALNTARVDVANAVGDLGAGAVNAATASIAPPGRAPVAVPLTSTRTLVIVGVLVALLVVVYLIARRRRR